MNTINSTIVKPQTQLVWLVDYSAPSVETESHDAVMMPTRDRDGKFAPKFEKPVTTRQAKAKLTRLSQKQSAGIARSLEMENW